MSLGGATEGIAQMDGWHARSRSTSTENHHVLVSVRFAWYVVRSKSDLQCH